MKPQHLILLLFFTTFTAVFAQKSVKISGQITDGLTKEPIPYANITATKNGLQLNGVISTEDGEFILKATTPDSCSLNVSFMGYQSKQIKIDISDNKVLNLGKIELLPTRTELNQVNIEANRAKQVVNLETQTYTIGDNIAATGGTIIDMMQSVPGITVDMNGNVKLRGSSKIGFLIDNKPSALLGAGRTGVLKQIPAGSIEKIEVITNPSAKYDPEGMAGIINIVFKEEKREGFNGEVGITLGAPNYFVLPSAGLNYRNKNLNIFGNIDGVFKEFLHNNRNTDRLKSDNSSQRQLYKTDEKVEALIYRLGADYTFGSKKNNQITAYWQYEDEYETNIGDIKYWDFKPGGIYDSSRIRSVNELEYNYITDMAIEYKHEFAPGTELNGGIIYSFADEEEDYYFKEFKTNQSMEKIEQARKSEKTMLSNLNKTVNIYADFVKSLGETGKLEAGYRSVVRNIDLNHLWYNTLGLTEILIPGSNYHYVYDEQIHSVYTVYSNKMDNWRYEAGLRFEQTNTKSREDSTIYEYSKSYPLLFPSLKVGFTLNQTHELLLSYSGRINRPDFEQLTYIPKFIDPLNLYQGNPELDPEYIHNFELGYKKGWDKGFVQLATFFKNINNPIYEIVKFNNTGVATFQPYNFDHATNLGGEAIFGYDPTENFTINGSFSYFKNSIAKSAITNTEARDDYSWNAKLSSMLSLPKHFKLQLDGWYNAPINTPQGKIYEESSVDFSATKRILNGDGELSLKVTDIFNTLEHKESFESGDYKVTYIDAPATRYVFLGFKYKF